MPRKEFVLCRLVVSSHIGETLKQKTGWRTSWTLFLDFRSLCALVGAQPRQFWIHGQYLSTVQTWFCKYVIFQQELLDVLSQEEPSFSAVVQ
eukprot:g45262.t1